MNAAEPSSTTGIWVLPFVLSLPSPSFHTFFLSPSHGACQTISILLPIITRRAAQYSTASAQTRYRLAEIRCEIFNHQLKTDRSSGPYEALSYVWGNSGHRRRLFVRDNSFWNSTQAYQDVTTNPLPLFVKLEAPKLRNCMG